MLPIQIQYDNPQHKEFIKFCNTLRCPLCGSQLDGNLHAKRAQLYCVSDNAEYKVRWLPGQIEPDYEMIMFTYTQYQYEVTYGKDYWGNPITVINRYNMDASPTHRLSTKKEVFKVDSRVLFFRSRMEEEVFLKKLKLYNLFS